MSYQQLINAFWQQYSSEIKTAREIHALFEAAGEQVVNDHIALRTFDDPRVDIEVLAEPFKQLGYVEQGHYDFPIKKLFAKYYQHVDECAPKIFISQLSLGEFSKWLQQFIREIIDHVPSALLNNPRELLLSGVPWPLLAYRNYEKLLKESQYAAWMYAYGFRANHFTVSVNHLKKYNTIQKVNALLKSKGFVLNTENGEVKGSPEEMLEQSSTMAEIRPVEFQEGTFSIPACYYEFALRYKDKAGKLYQGFVAASADKIFESTHVRDSKNT